MEGRAPIIAQVFDAAGPRAAGLRRLATHRPAKDNPASIAISKRLGCNQRKPTGGTFEETQGSSMFDAQLQIRDMRHRMANDLALLASALEQERRSRASTPDETIDDAVGSVLTLAAHYRRLYEFGGKADFVDLPGYIGALGQGLRTAYLDRLGVRLDCQIADIAVPPAVARDIGCIVMEMISNAAKHAFGSEGGRVIVNLTDGDAALVCTVVDDGCGLDKRGTDQGFELAPVGWTGIDRL
jgi:two-component sensor histidine kinase